MAVSVYWILDRGNGPLTHTTDFYDTEGEAALAYTRAWADLRMQGGYPVSHAVGHQFKVEAWPCGAWLQITGPEAR